MTLEEAKKQIRPVDQEAVCAAQKRWDSIATVSYTHLDVYKRQSLIIAYAPCINHGIKKGMSKAQTEEELAVKCGYWHNFRFNPAAENKFTLDSKAPNMDDYQAFLDGEVRYNSLKRLSLIHI